jgi:hypothetical protein
MAVETAGSESAMNEHRLAQFPPITWNSRLGVYESAEPVSNSVPRLGKLTQYVIAFAAIWSLCELPVEVMVSRTALDGAACITGKLIWLALSLWALSGSRPAKATFAFCCAASAMAIAFGLQAEQQFFPLGFFLSGVECALKAAAFLLIVVTPGRRAGN